MELQPPESDGKAGHMVHDYSTTMVTMATIVQISRYYNFLSEYLLPKQPDS